MTPRSFLSIVLLAVNLPASASDWPWWRGPDRNGVADADAAPPTEFGETQGVLWSVPIPGRGHGSACVAGDRVYLATADEETQIQAMHGFERATGKLLWTTVIHEKGLTQKINKKASWASGTPACDGERVYINFLSGDGVFTTALDLDGKWLWQTKVTDYLEHQGYGSSPAIHGDLVIVSADNKGATGGPSAGSTARPAR